ncbi:YdcF family protein [Pasteurella multocida subsp. multocida]|uniref:YdcF family protein n=1 Tax=Pasteurella multocida TaxID=747 RepID=A0A9X3UMZ4_PASMD|nr:YdcF family protein [Pasteurella multocida]MBF6979860.1 YdcF family protein [Pasteurella multocida]MBF6984295.1 YdcF family protein [Pasteurella multocida]MDA5608057.1 YdcF family protein [Pasteurella multocida subsp. multocida]MDA5609783.1 YdcF family protein [Pasteurella multocida]MDA5612317.1 YdcF family protein [Pasteurella multocida]
MFGLTKLITVVILPPFNVLILWLLSLLFSVLHYKKLSRLCALLGLTILYIFSLPYTSHKIEDSLVIEDKLGLADYQQAQAIVLLGGGLRDSKELYDKLTVSAIPLERVRYAAYLQKQTQLPLLITGSSPKGISEAQIMANELNAFFSVPTTWVEGKARTTKENALFSREILEKEGIKRVIVVTNQWHMQRAKLLFEQQGFEVLPASVGHGISPQSYGLNVMYFIPQAGALNKNMLLLKEWLGYWKEK